MVEGRPQRGRPLLLVGILIGVAIVGVPVLFVLFVLLGLPGGGRPDGDGKTGGGAEVVLPTPPPGASVARPSQPPSPDASTAEPPPGAAPRDEATRRFLGVMKRAFRAEAEQDPGSDDARIEDPMAVIIDPGASLGSRRRAAWIVAQRGDEAALGALAEALADAPPSLRATIAEALGHSGNPAAREMLLGIFSSESDDAVLRGAVKGIAAMGGDDGADLLGSTLHSPQHSAAVRAEAAEALGSVRSPEALSVLLDSYESLLSTDPDLARSVLAGLGKRDFSETRPFFEALLDSPRTDGELRVAAMEALEQASGDVGRFLLRYVDDPDPDLRAAAAWSLAMADEPGSLSEDLLGALGRESDAAVRSRIYQALENQEMVDGAAMLRQAMAETDPGARLTAIGLAADGAARGEAREQFDAVLAPELTDVALGEADAAWKMRAVSALRRARTPGSLEALRAIASRSAEPRVAEAARAELEKTR